MADQTFSEIVTRTIRETHNRGVTFRRYGQHGELQRMMVHRWPAEKIRGARPYLVAVLEQTNSLFRSLNRKGKGF